MFKFLHAADIHLDSPLHRLESYEGAPAEGLRRSTRRALENLVELAIREEVSLVLIAGDLFDGDWRDYNTGLFLVSQLSRLREAGIPVYIVAGNHDAASRITRTMRLPEGTALFSSRNPETFLLEGRGVAVHGRSFPEPGVRRNLAREYPPPVPGYFNIGLLHTCATGREGHEPYAPCTLEDLGSKGYDYWALGHVHQREVLQEHPLSVFPGNVQGRHIRETGPKGCVLVTVDDRGRPRAEFRALDALRWFRVEVDGAGLGSGYDVVDAFTKSMEGLLEENRNIPLILRAEVVGACPAHEELTSDPERWTNEIRSAALDRGAGRVWMEKVRLRTTPPGTRGPRSGSGPLDELFLCMEELKGNPAMLRDLAGVLRDLHQKLPRELAEGAERFPLDDEAWLSGVLEQVRSLLVRRLTSDGGEE